MNIAVIGGGVVGLTSALELIECGHRVQVYARDFSPGTTSDVAAGLIFPVAVHRTPLVLGAANDSLVRWAAEAHAGSPVRRQRHVEFTRTLAEAKRDVLPFGKLFDDFMAVPPHDLPAPYSYGWTFTTFIVDTRQMMPCLMARCAAAGVRFIPWEFSNRGALNELPHSVIVNCTGLGARDLFGDEELYPIKGQLLHIAPTQLPFSVVHGRHYVIPRHHDTVLGGTQEHNVWDLAPSAAVTREILAANRIFIPDLDEESVIAVRTGLRPYRRTGPRVGIERIKGKLIAHNYGHGGSGWTLAWGCAELLVAQLEHALAQTAGRDRNVIRARHADDQHNQAQTHRLSVRREERKGIK